MHNQKRSVILYVSHSADLYGAELCLLNLVASLNKHRFVPIVVLPKKGPLKQKLEELGVSVVIIPSIRAWLTRRNGIQRFFHLLAVIPFILASSWRLKQMVAHYRVNLVHTNSLVTIDGALAAWISGIPHIWHARELLIPESVFNFVFGPNIALSVIARLSSQVIAMSSGVKQTFHQYQNRSKVTVVYDGLKPSALEPEETKIKIRNDLGIPFDAPLIGEVGRLTAIKGYEDFVKAAAIVRETVPNSKFIGVGGRSRSDEPFEREILRLIDRYNLRDSFKLIGYRDDILDIMAALDLLVLPSHSEAFGRVLVEAMAAGKPVIGTYIGGIPEIIEDGITGLLIPPRSPGDLAQAIIRILLDQDLAHRMGAAGRRRAQAHFSLQRNVTEIEKIYEKLIK